MLVNIPKRQNHLYECDIPNHWPSYPHESWMIMVNAENPDSVLMLHPNSSLCICAFPEGLISSHLSWIMRIS